MPTPTKPYKLTALIKAREDLNAARDTQAHREECRRSYTDAQREEAAAAVQTAFDAYRETCAELSQLIADAEGRAHVRRLTVDDVLDAVGKVPTAIRKKSLVGCIVKDYDPNAQSFPGAYKGIPDSTKASLIYRPSGWYLTEIRRSRCTADSGRLILTDAAKADILETAARL